LRILSSSQQPGAQVANVSGFQIIFLPVLATIAVGVDFETGSHPAGLFGSGQFAFGAEFPTQPSLATSESPNWGFGDFSPRAFSKAQFWEASPQGFVFAGSRRGTARGALIDLVKTARLHYSAMTSHRGAFSPRLV
jgi:hypothetical protein